VRDAVTAEEQARSSRVPPLRRLIAPIVVIVVGIALAGAATLHVGRAETRAIMRDFELDTATRAGLVRREIDLKLEVLQSLVGLFAALETVSNREFRIFAVHALIRHPDLAALEWAPFVRHERRAAVEQEARQGSY